MRMNLRAAVSPMAFAALCAAGLSAAGCASVTSVFTNAKSAPDEYRVVAKAPLVVPPDYALRPPSPGQPRPQELQPQSQARLALLGQEQATTRDPGETLLANRAGAEKADPLISYVVDDEFGDLAHKDKSFADRVMFWKKGAPEAAAPAKGLPGADVAAPLDPQAEQDKIKALTGNSPVIIARAPPKKKFKLPGL